MLVTPQMEREIDKQLAKVQGQAVILSKEYEKHVKRMPSARELQQISLRVGDLELEIKRAINGTR